MTRTAAPHHRAPRAVASARAEPMAAPAPEPAWAHSPRAVAQRARLAGLFVGGAGTAPGAVVQRYDVPARTRFADLAIGRSKNAGIVDEARTLGTGLQFTQHFHCNGWVENAATFTSFTGTFFNVGRGADRSDVIYHYTIGANGGAWVGGVTPPEGAMAMRIATEAKLASLTAPAGP